MKFITSLLCSAVLLAGMPVFGQEVSVFEFGVSGLSFDNREDGVSGSTSGIYAAAEGTVPLGGILRARFGFEGVKDSLQGGLPFEDLHPGFSAQVTAALDAELSFGTVGAFVGAVSTSSLDGGVQPIGGLHGMFRAGTVDIVAKLGYANIRVDGADSGFTGAFGQLGAVFDLGPNVSMMAALGRGFAPEAYDDPGDSGTYTTYGLKGVWDSGASGGGLVTFGVERMVIVEGNTFDSGSDTRVTLGYAIALGGGDRRAALRPLAVPLAPARAASYGEVLE